MPSLRIGASLRPSFFISYSRKQKNIAEALKETLANNARSVWVDIESIVIGDNWKEEIYLGLSHCDELVLLVSDDSLGSKAVAEELKLATEQAKPIRPIIVAPLTTALPDALADLQYIDLSRRNTGRELRSALSELFDPLRAPAKGYETKVLACRGIWPAFDPRFAMISGRTEAISIAGDLERIRNHYAPSSPIWLNAGLMHCIGDNWETGLNILRAHSRAANTFAGWYFLALHLPQRRLVLRLSSKDCHEALDAVRTATSFGTNPLCLLLNAVLEVGAANAGPAHLARTMELFRDVENEFAEQPSEYARLYWCMQSSLGVLREYQQMVVALIRGKMS